MAKGNRLTDPTDQSARKPVWRLAGYAVLAAIALARRGGAPAEGFRNPPFKGQSASALREPFSTLGRGDTDATADTRGDRRPSGEKPAPATGADDPSWWGMLRQAATQWVTHKDARLGAALSYYSVFSIGPLIVIAIAVAGLFLGQEAVRGEVTAGLQGLLGESGAKAVNDMLAAANRPTEGTIAALIGIGTLIFAALGVVVQLKDALNTVWEVDTPPGSGIWGFVRSYVLSFAGVLALGFLLLVSLLLTTALSAGGKYFAPYLPEAVFQIVSFAVSFGVISVLFAMMFKWLPDADVAWRDVWIGGVATAALFEVGKFLIGLYIGKQGLESTYGAASSIVVVLVWVYYSAQIVLFGAEFTNVYAKARGSLSRSK